jgi:hypothetical protein
MVQALSCKGCPAGVDRCRTVLPSAAVRAGASLLLATARLLAYHEYHNTLVSNGILTLLLLLLLWCSGCDSSRPTL